MRRNILDGKHSAGNAPDLNQVVSQLDEGTVQNVQQLVDRYSGKSESELMGELLNSRQKGMISDDELNRVASNIAPMLNGAQQAKLNAILSKLKNG